MRVCEGQDLGIVTALIISLAVYGWALLHDRQPRQELPLPWGNQGPGMIAAEVTDSRDGDGVYFFPKGTDPQSILNIIDGEAAIDAAGAVMPDGAAIAISLAGGTLRISGMPAIRRLALGLPIDLNQASADDLALVPGIGERMAVEIVQRRRMAGKFSEVSDLTAVPGIKEKKLNALKKYLTVGSTP